MKTSSKLSMIGLALLLLALAGACSAQPPPSKGAPKVGQKAADFTLPDSSGKSVKLSDLFAASQGQKAPWVLLIFYRGYW